MKTNNLGTVAEVNAQREAHPGYMTGIIPNRLDPINLKTATARHPDMFSGMDDKKFNSLRMGGGFVGRDLRGVK